MILNMCALYQRTITMAFKLRARAMVIALFGIGQLHAQPLDSLAYRFRDLPLDSLVQRERNTTDLRTQCVVTGLLCVRYLYLGRSEECMRVAMRGLERAERLGNDTVLSRAHLSLGNAFSLINDINSTLDHFNTAFSVAERTGDSLGMGFICKETAVTYSRMNDHEGAMRHMRRAFAYGMRATVHARGMATMARCYLEMGQLDSALYCAQQADIIKVPGEDPYGYASYQGTLAAVYAARKEADLAETYFKRAVAVADSFEVPQVYANVAAGYANLLMEQGRTTEALAWARKGFRATEGSRQPRFLIGAAAALADAFHANGVDDSAFVYSKLSNAYRDSLTFTQNQSQMQSRSFAQRLKDIEDDKLRAEEVAARSHNIQFGIIALIVITLGIFLLIFSRTSIVGAKAIKNLSLIALLLFFEFINLLVHPMLGEITHHSPLLMLLCMAAIAGLLIPLHHRMEKLITDMLVSKNSRVRLEAARRTIEELEGARNDASENRS